MRKYNVFGKKLTKMRPFYLLLAIFILIIPAHFILNYFQENKLSQLEDEQIELETSINELLSTYNQDDTEALNLGNLYSGFEYHHFDYYLQEKINLYLDLANLTLVESKRIEISTITENPFNQEIDDDISIKKIELEFTANSHSDVLDFIEILLNQDQLFYISNYNVSLLNDNSYRINVDLYAFYIIF
ncbi:MAG: hypothetical protein ACOCV1_03775 [Bacillota bacterium]